MIDWTKLDAKVSDHFKVKEAIWLPQWNRLAATKDGLTVKVQQNLILTFAKMDIVRDFVNAPIVVHVSFRPTAYNALVKGAKNSAHLYGMAVDFHVKGMDCDTVRKLIVPKLAEWGLRCEDLPGSTWVHLDRRPPGAAGRFFKP